MPEKMCWVLHKEISRKRYGEFEEIKEDDSISDLLTERDAALSSNKFYDKTKEFKADLFWQQTTSANADISFDAMCDIDIEALEFEKWYGVDSDIKGNGDKNGEG